MQINIDESIIMRVSRRNEYLRIEINTRELKEADHFKYLGSVLTKDSFCTREIKMSVVIAKEAFNRKTSLLTMKLKFEPKKKLVRIESVTSGHKVITLSLRCNGGLQNILKREKQL